MLMDDILFYTEYSFRSLADNLPEVVFRFDKHLRCVYVNPAITKVMGMPRNSFLGKTNIEAGAPKELAVQWNRNLREVFKTHQPNSFEYDIPTQKGIRRFQTINAPEILEDGSVKSVICINHDLTEEKQVKATLARAKEELEKKVEERTTQLSREKAFFRAITENALDSIIISDVNGIIRYQNATRNPALGYSDKEAVGRSAFDFVHPEDSKTFREIFKNINNIKNNTVHFEARLKDKNGSWRFCEIIGKNALDNPAVKGLIFNFRDITKRKKAEDRLRQNEIKLKNIFDNMDEAIIVVDLSGQPVSTNPAIEGITGYKKSEILKRNFKDPKWQYFYSDKTPMPAEETPLAKAIASKRKVRNKELGMKKPDGSLVWMFGSAVPLYDKDKQLYAFIAAFTDITEQKRLRDELELYSQKIIHIQEEERKHIARELHDDTAQNLSILGLELDALIANNLFSIETIDKLKTLKTNVDQTMLDIRRYSHELHPALLDHLGLLPALEQMIGEINSKGNLQIQLEVLGQESRLGNEVELALFRIVQESLHNVRKHANSNLAKVSVQYYPEVVNLSIADYGKGFDVTKESESAIAKGSLGLLSMRERAHLIGAKLSITSKINEGTVITVEIPR